ncbi:MAG: site-2 protease family protein [Pyrinomonadaceae bacterium]|nr:site-2 protease family protein [Pyrinomonadaceae bacterium]MCX7639516.1 site-2 protease family protein [Pyrinomonadaceae bacterium]MDW8304433.1 site-2 protease family protein [Acidobacteriota bacterium]
MKGYKAGLLQTQIKVFQIGGVPILISYGWIVVFLFISWLIATNLPKDQESFVLRISLGVLASALFFASVVLHELAHAKVAKKEGIKVLEILLHPFGGLAIMEKEPETPKAELRIAIAGPSISLLISFIFLILFMLARTYELQTLTLLLAFLFFCNFFLAIFNFLPGYPLDGGRILRAILLQKGVQLEKATLFSGKVGQLVAILLFFLGLMIIAFRSDFVAGFWIGMTGLFLLSAANKAIKSTFRRNLTIKPSIILPPDMLIAEFLNRILPISSQKVFPVGKAEKLDGVLLLDDLKKMSKSEWHEKTVSEAMRTIQENYIVYEGDLAIQAEDLIKRNGIGAAIVVDNRGKVLGFFENMPKDS